MVFVHLNSISIILRDITVNFLLCGRSLNQYGVLVSFFFCSVQQPPLKPAPLRQVRRALMLMMAVMMIGGPEAEPRTM